MFGDIAADMDANKLSTFQIPLGAYLDCYHYDVVGIKSTVIKPETGILEIKYFV